MGREWLYWVGGGGSAARRRRSATGEMKEAAETSAGCMCAVFQLFDLHHFQLPLNHQIPSNEKSFLQDEATSPKGVEAPRNSLELDEPVPIKANPAMKVEENLNFPVGIQIKTRPGKTSSARTEEFWSENSSNSPGTKTPNLVARLMGLDLLPESTSPSINSSSVSKSQLKSHFHQKNLRKNAFFNDDISVGARSLPETPRISSSSRKSDVEYHHHRLSLQVNKDNSIEEFGTPDKLSRKGRRFRHQDQNNRNSTTSCSSPGHYAKQIVKQVKESVSKRVGLSDITNRNNNKDEIMIRRDENLILIKPTKKISENGVQNTTPSCSPRLRFMETNKKMQMSNPELKSPRISSPFTDHNPSQGIIVINPEHQRDYNSKKAGKCVKRLPLPHQARDKAIRNKKDEQFVRTKAEKKTQMSGGIISISGPTLLQVKKYPSHPPAKLPQKQAQVSDALSSKSSTQLSSYPSHSYNHKIFTTVPPDNHNGCATSTHGGATAAYGNYIQKILKRTGLIEKITPLTSIKWHTPSHPIDPSVFYYLELFHPSSAVYGGASERKTILSHRCNRKLIFQLVDEILGDILRPHLEFKPWVCSVTWNDHLPLVDLICKKIDDFPAANCRVLEDIDLLIDKDLCKVKQNGFFEEEWESIVCEIEGGIMADLVAETAALWGGRTPEEYRQRLTGGTW